MLGIIIVTDNYKDSVDSEKDKKDWFQFYTNNLVCVNNWDLVDTSIVHVVGDYLLHKDRSILYHWIQHENPWHRRCAIVACMKFIHNSDFTDILHFAKLTLNDEFDLNHKAAGWMLREVDKKDRNILLDFIQENFEDMPRVMLRY